MLKQYHAYLLWKHETHARTWWYSYFITLLTIEHVLRPRKGLVNYKTTTPHANFIHTVGEF